MPSESPVSSNAESPISSTQKLRNIMVEQNINLGDLHNALQIAGYDIPHATVESWYYGRRRPGERGLRALATTLGVPMEAIASDYPADEVA